MKVFVYYDEEYPHFFYSDRKEICNNSVEIELTEEELAKIKMAEKFMNEAQCLLRRRMVGKVGENKVPKYYGEVD